MDAHHLVELKGLDLIPGEELAGLHHIAVIDRPVTHTIGMDIEIVGQHHIRAALALTFLQKVQKRRQIGAERIVAVHYLKIRAGSMGKALVDALSVTAVFLVDHPDDLGIALGVAVGDGAGIILRAVINDNDLHAVTAGDQAFDTFFHIILRIIAGNRYSQQFHGIISSQNRLFFSDIIHLFLEKGKRKNQ